MCEFLQGDDLSKRIREVVKGKDARCAVAFWGRDAVRELFGTEVLERDDVHVVCDLSMGGTNPATLRALGAPNNSNIKYHDGLHAKVFLSENGAVVGSANASNNGIGFMGGNAQLLEAGTYHSRDSDAWDAISGWFAKLSERETREVDAEALNAAQLAWNSRRKESKQSGIRSDGSFLDYDPEVDGLVHILWRNWNGDVTEDCSLDGLAAPRSWQNLAIGDYDILNSWAADFLPTAPKSKIVFFFANDVRKCEKLDKDYPVVYFQNKKKELLPPPFNFDDEILRKAFKHVIEKDAYKALKCFPERGCWFVSNYLHDMHCFWRDVQDEYRRHQGSG